MTLQPHPDTAGEVAARLFGRDPQAPGGKGQTMRSVQQSFAHLAQVFKEAGGGQMDPRVQAALQAVQASVLNDMADLKARVSVIEDGIVALDDTFTPATGARAAAATSDSILDPNAEAAPMATGDAVQTAVITPIDPTDPIRAGAGTVVTSPAPVAVPESAEPVTEETPDVAAQAATAVETASN